jgi:hypothetical protein
VLLQEEDMILSEGCGLTCDVKRCWNSTARPLTYMYGSAGRTAYVAILCCGLRTSQFIGHCPSQYKDLWINNDTGTLKSYEFETLNDTDMWRFACDAFRERGLLARWHKAI